MALEFQGFARDDLKSIKAPVLITIGDRDGLRLEHAVEMFRLIPDAQLAVFPGADHFLTLAEPGETVADDRGVPRCTHAEAEGDGAKDSSPRLGAQGRAAINMASLDLPWPIGDDLIGRHDGFRYPSHDRRGLEDRVGEAHRRSRADRPRRRARRGPGAGCAGRRAGAMAGVGRPEKPGRLAHGHRQASRDRHAPPKSVLERKHEEIGRELEAERGLDAPDLDAALDDDDRRRPAAPRLHGLPSGPLRPRRASR